MLSARAWDLSRTRGYILAVQLRIQRQVVRAILKEVSLVICVASAILYRYCIIADIEISTESSTSELEPIQERSIFSKTRISNHEDCSKREKRTTTDKTKPGDIVNKRDKEQQAPTFLLLLLVTPFSAERHKQIVHVYRPRLLWLA